MGAVNQQSRKRKQTFIKIRRNQTNLDFFSRLCFSQIFYKFTRRVHVYLTGKHHGYRMPRV